MKTYTLIVTLGLAALVGCSGAPEEGATSEKAPVEKADAAGKAPGAGPEAMAQKLPADAVHVGEGLEGKPRVALAKVQADPDAHLEQTLLVEATAEEICQARGCWMTITDGEGEPIWVRWASGCGGKYAFPKDAAGKRVLVQGSFYAKEIAPKDAEHLAEESKGLKAEEIAGRTFEMNATACVVLPPKESTEESAS